MAEKIFISHSLSEEMILTGQALINKLDETNAKVAAAFWLLEDNESTWELIIVSPLVESEGSRNYYKIINEINDLVEPNKKIISLHNIRVSGNNNKFVKAIKNSVLGNAVLGNNRLGRNFLSGAYFEDMYLYRMDWALLAQTLDKAS